MAQQQMERSSNHEKRDYEVDEQEQRDIAARAIAHAQTQPEVDMDKVDELLGEIDDLLEVNAEEFVAEFKQKGGQ